MTETQTIPLGARIAQTRVPLGGTDPKTLVEVFLSAARNHDRPDALGYKRDGEWRHISSSELIARARAIAAGLYSLGLRPGDRAAILSENCPEWTLSDAGAHFCGVIDVPIYSTQAEAQVAYILNDSGSRLLFIQNRQAFERVREAVAQCPGLAHFVFFDPAGAAACGAISLAELEEMGRKQLEGSPSLSDELESSVQAENLATIIYTSGTTGEPKGVMLTHANIVSNVLDSSNHLSFGEQDVVLSVLPLSHVFERTAMYMYIEHGMGVRYAEAMDKIGQNLREVRPTVMIGVPRIFEKIYQKIKDKAAESGRLTAIILAWATRVGSEWARHKTARGPVPLWCSVQHSIASALVFRKWREGFGGRMRLLVSGGAALSPEIGYIFLGAGLPILQGYGLTETSPVISAGSLEDNRIGTVGKPIRNVEVRIAPDGEIEVQGPNVMQGYYNKPEATAAVFTEDGWFRTGDIGFLDKDGYLSITDRKKELFKTSGGKYIAPQQVEQLIKGSRFVSQVVLVGDKRKFPAALIVPDWEQLRSYSSRKGLDVHSTADLITHPRILDLFRRQIESHTNGLAQFEKVKTFALLENELTIDGGELTPTLKVKRRVIDEKYCDLIDRMYAEAEASYRESASGDGDGG